MSPRAGVGVEWIQRTASAAARLAPALLVLQAASCGGSGSPPRTESPHAFPSLAPFEASRMWSTLMEEGGPPSAEDALERKLELVASLIAALRETDEAMEEMFGPAPPSQAKKSGLDPGLSSGESSVGLLVPVALSTLRPLWGRSDWSEGEQRLAERCFEFFARLPDGPGLEAVADPHDRLERVVAWFEARMEDPAAYASMIFTFDDGPWRPREVEASEPFEPFARKPLVAGRELQLARPRAERSWALRCIEAGEPLWTVELTEVPQESSFDFLNRDPTPLDRYGWKVHMSFGEYVHVYLDEASRPLFYFTSW